MCCSARTRDHTYFQIWPAVVTWIKRITKFQSHDCQRPPLAPSRSGSRRLEGKHFPCTVHVIENLCFCSVKHYLCACFLNNRHEATELGRFQYLPFLDIHFNSVPSSYQLVDATWFGNRNWEADNATNLIPGRYSFFSCQSKQSILQLPNFYRVSRFSRIKWFVGTMCQQCKFVVSVTLSSSTAALNTYAQTIVGEHNRCFPKIHRWEWGRDSLIQELKW